MNRLRELSVLVLPPAVVLPFLPLPLVWICLFWAAVLVVRARRSARPRVRRSTFAAAGILLAFALAELAAYAPEPASRSCAHDDRARPTLGDPFDGVTGYGPMADQQARGRDLPGGSPEYGMLCTIDANGQRATPSSAAGRAVLFFGGSYTFGDGVLDRETAAWLAGEALGERARVYNFAYSGYGPHQALALTQAGRVEEVVEARPRIAVYQLILSHVSRVSGRVSWEAHGPRYTLDESGRAVRAGRFCDAPLPVPWLESLARRSSFYRKIRSRTSTRSEIVLCVAVLDELRRELEARFPGCELHILFWDERRAKSRRILEELERAGLRVHLVSDFLTGYAEDRTVAFLSATDYHPHPQAHAQVARYVVGTICADLESEAPGKVLR